MRAVVWIFLLNLFIPHASAQLSSPSVERLIGFWEGAFIKENSYQKIDIQFYEEDGNLLSLQVMEEWHPTFGEFIIPVDVDKTGRITLNTGLGKAIMQLDTQNLEINGTLEGSTPPVYIHLKKVPAPPASLYEAKPITVDSDGNLLNGHLHLPKTGNSRTAVIIVGGRGCNADETKHNLYAKFLRSYGIAVLAYQKRGTGNSSGDCSMSTIDDLASDLSNIYNYLNTDPHSFDNIGVLGISAGGWTMIKAAESTDFDFMISIVGPATSVYDQQMQSMAYGAEFYGLSAEAIENLTEYTELMFEAKAKKRGFAKMNDLLQIAEEQGWEKLLENTDIPDDASGIDRLWVRRHSYDPSQSLRKFNKPFLGIYGGRDWIVPARENIELLELYFEGRSELLKTIIAHDAEHGMEKEAKTIELNAQKQYWRFYRIAPEVRIEIVDFLRIHGFIDK